MASGDKHCLYKEWMKLQEDELYQLLQQQSLNNTSSTATENGESNSSKITELLDKIIDNFQDYVNSRSRLVRKVNDASAFFTPNWCTPLENSLSWVAGCRPSSFFNLVFALCGTEMGSDDDLSHVFEGLTTDDGKSKSFPLLSAFQLSSVDSLQRKTIHEEEKLTSKVASLQQRITDMPLAQIARKSCPGNNLNHDVKDAIDEIQLAMVSAMEEADELRLNTCKELFRILTPIQALEYIISAKKLRLCLQMWGIERERENTSLIGREETKHGTIY